MLDYEWVNPSTIILTGNETATAAVTDSDQHNYAAMLPHPILHGSTTQNNGFSHHNNHFNFNFNPSPPQLNNNQHHPFFDTRAFQSASSATFSPPPPSMLPLNPIAPLATSHCGLGLGLGSGLGLLLMPKSEHAHAMNVESSGHGIGHGPGPGPGPGLGLNLGGRTYFSSCNDISAHHRLHRSVESVPSSNSPRCQAEGCNADLSNAKHYHRRHKVCEYHSKAATVVAAGLTQRFCQQCSRFHLLSEFDNGKRSCRKRLADHNRRRRKNQQHQQAQEIHKPQPSLDNVARSSPERGGQSWSSLKMKVSPPDYFQEKPNCNNRGSSSTTSSSLFFSTG